MNKNNGKGLIVLVACLSFIILCLGSYIMYRELSNDENSCSNIIESDNSMNEDIDYLSLIGQYVGEDGKSIDDIRNNGGIILNIDSISKTLISFSIESVSSSQRVSIALKENIFVYDIVNNEYKFTWVDSFNNFGVGTISVSDREIILNLITTKIDDNNSSGWSLGNFDNLKMFKVGN